MIQLFNHGLSVSTLRQIFCNLIEVELQYFNGFLIVIFVLIYV